MTLLVLCSIFGWTYRAQLAGAYRSFRRPHTVAVAPSPSKPGVQGQSPSAGHPSRDALKRARDKEAAIERRGGPGVIALTPDELASLVADGLDPAARQSLDSITVTLARDRFTLDARVRTAAISEALGPLSAMLNPYEPIRISGPAHMTGPGLVAWAPDDAVIRAFPVPKMAIPSLISRLTGSKDGTIPILVPVTVADLRIGADSVMFYRRGK